MRYSSIENKKKTLCTVFIPMAVETLIKVVCSQQQLEWFATRPYELYVAYFGSLLQMLLSFWTHPLELFSVKARPSVEVCRSRIHWKSKP